MKSQNKLIFFTALFFVSFLYFGITAENIFYVEKKSQLEEKKIETEEKQETLQDERQEIIKKENVEKTKDLEFSKMMGKMKGQVMEVSSVEKQIREISKEMNFNPETAVRIAMCESLLCPTAKNKVSSATGIFQFMTGTWNAYCAGNRLSVEDSTRCFIKLYPKYPHYWECHNILYGNKT